MRLSAAFLRRLALPAALAFLWAAAPAFGGPSDDDCLTCHGDAGLKTDQDRSLFVDGANFAASIHGAMGIACVDCHADLKKLTDFPHAAKLKPVDCAVCHDKAETVFRDSVHGQPHEVAASITVHCKDCHGTHDIRPASDALSHASAINIPDTCLSCHLELVKTKRGPGFAGQYKDSIHYRALSKAGLSLSATCLSCHGGHSVRPVDDPRSKVSRRNIIQTCGTCHTGIERDYLEGVHGKDYVKGVQDVPVCTDCHSEHDIRSPQDLGSGVYATKVAAVCTRCHDDETLARQYGLLTSRLKTFSASYHGTASKFGEVRVANCSSCHGHHGIRPSSDPLSSINPANIASTCGKCHPGAGKNFSKGRIHVVSEKTENRWAYAVKIIYIVIIAGLISVFLAFIFADLYRRLRIRWKS
jgi:predicted CXXCH cytochrome family protein